VTIVVLSLGLLGIASLQLQSKQSTLVAAQRSAASHLVHDLLERMRSNPEALSTYTPSDSVREISTAVASAPNPACTHDALCDAAQLAAHDIWQWSDALYGGLSLIGNDSTGSLLDPVACIARPAGGGSGNYTVAIAWRSTKGSGNPNIAANSTANNCGTTTGRFDKSTSGDNQLRHVFWVDSYIFAG